MQSNSNRNKKADTNSFAKGQKEGRYPWEDKKLEDEDLLPPGRYSAVIDAYTADLARRMRVDPDAKPEPIKPPHNPLLD